MKPVRHAFLHSARKHTQHTTNPAGVISHHAVESKHIVSALTSCSPTGSTPHATLANLFKAATLAQQTKRARSEV